MKTRAAWIVVILMILGCVNLNRTSAVRESELRPGALSLARKHDHQVAIIVKGRGDRQVKHETLTITILDVAEQLHNAIAAAILESQLFSNVVDESQADLLLTVRVLKADSIDPGTPKSRGDAVAALDWTLTRIEGGGLVFNEIIVRGKRPKDGLIFSHELEIQSNLEDALRRNIQRGLVRLSELRL